jgi:hypothetical protein
MEVHRAARKCGVADEDVVHATDNAITVDE